jgi:hypothetical protein
MRAFIAAVAAGVFALPASAFVVPQSPPQQAPAASVTVITDSVGGVLFWDPGASAEFADGLDVRLEVATCRKLVSTGCLAYDYYPPSALDTIEELGSDLAPIVVVETGYNDNPTEYTQGIDEVMQALVDASVQRVIWVTLEENIDPWRIINRSIRAAAARWPQLIVADWAPVVAGKPWIVDNAHLNAEGGFEFAKFLRGYVIEACGEPCANLAPDPSAQLEPVVTEASARIDETSLPAATIGSPYAASLVADGGQPPYQWAAISGVPRGLHLSASGQITGTPRGPARSAVISLQVADASGLWAFGSVALRVGH